MNATTCNNEKASHSIRPTHIVLGTDEAGAIHHWDTNTRTVHVIGADGRELRQELDADDPSAWMSYVRAERGWAGRRYYDGFLEAFSARLEVR